MDSVDANHQGHSQRHGLSHDTANGESTMTDLKAKRVEGRKQQMEIEVGKTKTEK